MSDVNKKSVAELEAELAEARRRERDEQQAAAEAVQPVYKFTLTPGRETDFYRERIMDETITLVRLEGHLQNADECRAVGKSPLTGGMTYYFNLGTGRFITATGGGSIWVGGFRREADDRETARAFAELAAFFVAHPEGGDVTEIINEHHSRRA